ncbi:MAG: hypothetical protein LBN93_04980, partial [Candidatus Symbiothrix sp.]|nr:hypothetical protein [Candidatus Symbiothrix sp.]
MIIGYYTQSLQVKGNALLAIAQGNALWWNVLIQPQPCKGVSLFLIAIALTGRRLNIIINHTGRCPVLLL